MYIYIFILFILRRLYLLLFFKPWVINKLNIQMEINVLVLYSTEVLFNSWGKGQ